MSGNTLRREVLKCFKVLHKARCYVFEEDELTLQEARKKINEEFRKNKEVTDEKAIQDLIKLGYEVENEMKTTIVQLREVKPGYFRARILPETIRNKNAEFPGTKKQSEDKS